MEKCANCGMPITPCAVGYTHMPDGWMVECNDASPTRTVVADDMLTWLRATIEGDKADALTLPHGPWHHDGVYPQRISNAEPILIAETYTDPSWPPHIADHIVRHDPRDTIARCEFELAEIARHAESPFYDCRVCGEHYAEYPCDYLRRHAYGYRHRAGWNPDWAPEGTTP